MGLPASLVCTANPKDWAQAAEWFRRDAELGRLSWRWQLRYAVVLLELGDEAAAVALVAQVYARHPDAGDAYARLGWVKARAKEWEGAYALMERDAVAQRLSPVWQVHFAQVVARLGCIVKPLGVHCTTV